MKLAKKQKYIFFFILIITIIAGFIGISTLDNQKENKINKNWETYTSSEYNLSFQYPESLQYEYISTVDWPPNIQIINENFNCTQAGNETDRAGMTRVDVIEGREYCITTVAEGAAGSIYRQYAYAFPYNNSETFIFTFSLRFPQCENYPEERKQECKNERKSEFNLNNLIDNISQTIKSQ